VIRTMTCPEVIEAAYLRVAGVAMPGAVVVIEVGPTPLSDEARAELAARLVKVHEATGVSFLVLREGAKLARIERPAP